MTFVEYLSAANKMMGGHQITLSNGSQITTSGCAECLYSMDFFGKALMIDDAFRHLDSAAQNLLDAEKMQESVPSTSETEAALQSVKQAMNHLRPFAVSSDTAKCRDPPICYASMNETLMPRMTWDMASAMKAKDDGNEFFRQGDYEMAIQKYSSCIDSLNEPKFHDCSDDGSQDLDNDKERSSALVACYSNKAQCEINLQRYTQALDSCNSALDVDSNHAKSLIRRAQANASLGNHGAAAEDYEAAFKLDVSLRGRHQSSYDEQAGKKQAEFNALNGEAMAQLKDAGNSLLGLFGMSLDNFSFNQNRDGGYSISMK